jgi:hypothetical protein
MAAKVPCGNGEDDVDLFIAASANHGLVFFGVVSGVLGVFSTLELNSVD